MAIRANEKILTLDYWKTASKIQPGDFVFDKDGQLVEVKLVQEIMAPMCYEVVFSDHLTVVGDKNLTFSTETPVYRINACRYKGKLQFRRQLVKKPVEDLINGPLRSDTNRLIYSVPTVKPLELPHQDLPIPPFIFGFWFFNQRANKTYTSPKGYSEKIHGKFKDHGYKIITQRKLPTQERVFVVEPTIESQLKPNIPNKIPENYLLASAEQRLELLQGILYAKGRQYNKSRDTFRITSLNLPILRQVQALVESLGHKTSLESDSSKQDYTLFFKSRLKLMDHQVSPKLKVHNARRYITKINEVAPQMCIHIETKGKDNSFLVGEGFIPCR
jgi:replicative DNA helicase